MRPFQELDVVTYKEDRGTIVHLYKRGHTAIVEFGNSGDLRDIPLDKLTLWEGEDENSNGEGDDVRGTV